MIRRVGGRAGHREEMIDDDRQRKEYPRDHAGELQPRIGLPEHEVERGDDQDEEADSEPHAGLTRRRRVAPAVDSGGALRVATAFTRHSGEGACEGICARAASTGSRRFGSLSGGLWAARASVGSAVRGRGDAVGGRLCRKECGDAHGYLASPQAPLGAEAMGAPRLWASTCRSTMQVTFAIERTRMTPRPRPLRMPLTVSTRDRRW